MNPTALPTMVVKYADGRRVIINERDFNPDFHFNPDELAPGEISSDAPAAPEVESDAPAAPEVEPDAPAAPADETEPEPEATPRRRGRR